MLNHDFKNLSKCGKSLNELWYFVLFKFNTVYVRSNLVGSQLLLQIELLNNFGSQKKRVEKRCLRGCLYLDPAPGTMQTERVCLHSQTLSIIAAFLFGLLLHFLQYFAIAKFLLARFTILAISLTCVDCLTSKITT